MKKSEKCSISYSKCKDRVNTQFPAPFLSFSLPHHYYLFRLHCQNRNSVGFTVRTLSVTLVAPVKEACTSVLYRRQWPSQRPRHCTTPGFDVLSKRSVMSLPGSEVRFLGCSVFSLVAILTADQFSHVEVPHSLSWKLKIPSLNTQTSVI